MGYISMEAYTISFINTALQQFQKALIASLREHYHAQYEKASIYF
jgi:hypothetical protein